MTPQKRNHPPRQPIAPARRVHLFALRLPYRHRFWLRRMVERSPNDSENQIIVDLIEDWAYKLNLPEPPPPPEANYD